MQCTLDFSISRSEFHASLKFCTVYNAMEPLCVENRGFKGTSYFIFTGPLLSIRYLIRDGQNAQIGNIMVNSFGWLFKCDHSVDVSCCWTMACCDNKEKLDQTFFFPSINFICLTTVVRSCYFHILTRRFIIHASLIFWETFFTWTALFRYSRN